VTRGKGREFEFSILVSPGDPSFPGCGLEHMQGGSRNRYSVSRPHHTGQPRFRGSIRVRIYLRSQRDSKNGNPHQQYGQSFAQHSRPFNPYVQYLFRAPVVPRIAVRGKRLFRALLVVPVLRRVFTGRGYLASGWYAGQCRAKMLIRDELNPWPIGVSAGAVTAAGVAAWGAVGASAELFGPTVRRTDSPKKLALTFDDGPNPAVTPQLLDLFDRYSVQATFFLIGKFARACHGLVREMSARGHALGNHTESHPNLIFQSRADIHGELARCQEAVAVAAGSDAPHWMRPPYGDRSPMLDGEVRRAGLHGIVMWSKICSDWKPQSPERLIARLARAARPNRSYGDVVVLHDGDHRALGGDRHHVVSALEHWLPRWRDTGIEFVTIDSCAAANAMPVRRV
jgi:peptidoglycan-N-acetylglucosamine deacetylase